MYFYFDFSILSLPQLYDMSTAMYVYAVES